MHPVVGPSRGHVSSRWRDGKLRLPPKTFFGFDIHLRAARLMAPPRKPKNGPTIPANGRRTTRPTMGQNCRKTCLKREIQTRHRPRSSKVPRHWPPRSSETRPGPNIDIFIRSVSNHVKRKTRFISSTAGKDRQMAGSWTEIVFGASYGMMPP